MNRLLAGLAMTLLAGRLAAVDWPTCSSALEDLKRRSQDAASASDEADTAYQALEQAKEDLENCREDPETYDLLDHECQSQEWEFDSAESTLDSAKQEAETRFRRLRNAIGDVASSCETDLSVPPPLTSLSLQAKCDRLRSLRGQLGSQVLGDYCRTLMPPETCKACLGNP